MADWFRWWHGTVTDPKFMWCARKSGQTMATVIAVWTALLEEASQADDRGDISGFDAESMDVALWLDDGISATVIHAMEAKGLIHENRLTGWERRQPNREDSGDPETGALSNTQRSRLHRERKKAGSGAAAGPKATPKSETQLDATQGNETQLDATQGNEQEESRGEESKPTIYITAREPGIPFPMDLVWDPSPHFPTLAHQAGVSVAEKSAFSESLAEFRSYWLTRSDTNRTQHEWDHALLISLKAGKMRKQQGPPAKTGKPSRHVNFDQIDYRKGISPDGRF